MKKEEEDELEDLEQRELLLRELNGYIGEAKGVASEGPKLPEFHNKLISAVEDVLYTNIIVNFIDNLAVEENQKEANISKIDVEDIESTLGEFLGMCRADSDSRDDVDSKIYETFKGELNKISKNAYRLLLEIEEYIKLP